MVTDCCCVLSARRPQWVVRGLGRAFLYLSIYLSGYRFLTFTTVTRFFSGGREKVLQLRCGASCARRTVPHASLCVMGAMLPPALTSLSFPVADTSLWPLRRGRDLESKLETTGEKCAYTTWMNVRVCPPTHHRFLQAAFCRCEHHTRATTRRSCTGPSPVCGSPSSSSGPRSSSRLASGGVG